MIRWISDHFYIRLGTGYDKPDIQPNMQLGFLKFLTEARNFLLQENALYAVVYYGEQKLKDIFWKKFAIVTSKKIARYLESGF